MVSLSEVVTLAECVSHSPALCIGTLTHALDLLTNGFYSTTTLLIAYPSPCFGRLHSGVVCIVVGVSIPNTSRQLRFSIANTTVVFIVVLKLPSSIVTTSSTLENRRLNSPPLVVVTLAVLVRFGWFPRPGIRRTLC